MAKAKIQLKPGVGKGSDGWGISIKDSKGNTYPITFAQRSIELPEQVAKDFEGSPVVDVIYSGQDKPVSKVALKPAGTVKKLTKKEAKDLTKNEQVDLLIKLGAEKIPRFESGRVNLILKLQ